MKMTQTDFEKLVTDVEKEFDLFLAKAESEAKPVESLAKSEEKEEEKEEAKEDAAEAEDEDEKKDEDSHDYDDKDIEELHKMYASMGKSELELHKGAIEKCGMQKCGEVKVEKSEQPTPEAKVEVKTEVKTETTEKPTEEVLTKSEGNDDKKTQEIALAKSELESKSKELADVKKDNEGLKKNVDELVAALNGFLTKKGPTRKAITSIEYIKKSEIENKAEQKDLKKSEITAILNRKAAEPSLSKADREAINNYYLKGASLEVVKHLLTQ